MKVLAIHNFHRKGSASGDDQVFASETALLEQHGVDVVKYTVCNDDFDGKGKIGKIVSTFGMLWSFKNYNAVKKLIEHENPDIVHIHTFFPLLSPSVLYAAKKSGKKVVATLHDTRFICPCATSLRGLHLCNECGDGHYFRMVRYGCFKNSRIQSLFVACIFKYHGIRKTFYRQIDKYICLNDNQKGLLINIGYNEKKIAKKYNSVSDANADMKVEKDVRLPSKYVVFYGRIGEEKGIRILMEIWDKIDTIPLVVMGGGPLEDEFQRWANAKENVYYLGYTEHNKCLSIVKSGQFVVFPSIWYEGCSMVEIEAESLGKCIIATDLGFSSEAIRNGVNGYKVNLGDINGFVEIIKRMWNNPSKCIELGQNARIDYENNYSPEDNFVQLINIYKNIIEGMK